MVKLSAYQKYVSAESERVGSIFAAVLSTDHPLCDVILRVPGSEATAWVSVGSNSVLLRMKSSVLDAMWQSDSSGKGVETIDITDCSEAAIRALNAVAFGQLDAVEITTENVADLLYAALKYDFKLVVDCCQQFIGDAIAKDDVNECLSVLSALHRANLTDFASKIATKCELFGSKKTTAAFECEAVTTLPFSIFRDFLTSDALKLSEEDIWLQCVKWAKLNSEQHLEATEDLKMAESDAEFGTDAALVSVLRSLTKHIRFPLMNHEFFMKHVVSIGVLSPQQTVDVCMAATGLQIVDKPFCCSQPRLCSFDLFDSVHFKVTRKGTKEVLRVTGDRRALFGCSKGWRTGVHKWAITVDKVESGFNYGFGVSQNCTEYKCPTESLCADGRATHVSHRTYFFWANAYYVTVLKGTEEQGSTDWVPYEEGDTVQLTLDCNNWTLDVVHNGSTQRQHSLDVDCVYFPVVCAQHGREGGLVQVTVEWL